jgi:hypothetical protein
MDCQHVGWFSVRKPQRSQEEVIMIKPQQAAPLGRKGRVSSDNAWPLRNSAGLTFAEAKRLREQEQSK